MAWKLLARAVAAHDHEALPREEGEGLDAALAPGSDEDKGSDPRVLEVSGVLRSREDAALLNGSEAADGRTGVVTPDLDRHLESKVPDEDKAAAGAGKQRERRWADLSGGGKAVKRAKRTVWSG